MVRIKALKVLSDFLVEFIFTDSSTRVIDLDPYLIGPIFDELRDDPSLFRAAFVDTQLRTIVWPNGADIDPDVLYLQLTPVAWESRAGSA